MEQGDVEGAISVLESVVSKLETRSPPSDDLHLAPALSVLADLHSSRGFSLRADELRSRAIALRAAPRLGSVERSSRPESGLGFLSLRSNLVLDSIPFFSLFFFSWTQGTLIWRRRKNHQKKKSGHPVLQTTKTEMKMVSFLPIGSHSKFYYAIFGDTYKLILFSSFSFPLFWVNEKIGRLLPTMGHQTRCCFPCGMKQLRVLQWMILNH